MTVILHVLIILSWLKKTIVRYVESTGAVTISQGAEEQNGAVLQFLLPATFVTVASQSHTASFTFDCASPIYSSALESHGVH